MSCPERSETEAVPDAREERIRQLLAAAPPLSRRQVHRLTALFRPGEPSTPESDDTDSARSA